jgi:Transcriptional regulator, AbiEi antitoxin
VGDSSDHIGRISQDPREAAIRELARRQIGHVTRAQLLELGLGSAAIGARVSTGALVTRYPGVYALPPARQDPQARIAAAVLAGGPGALASHTSAAFLWGFLPHFQPPPEISLPTGDRRPRHILTHRCPSLDRADNSLQLGVKVTSRTRTILDIAPRLTDKQRIRLVNDALREHHIRPDGLSDVIARNPYHPGTKLLKPFLDLPGTNPTNSAFEDDFLPFLAKYGLPTPLTNVYVNGREVDAYFPEHNLIVELDGWHSHKTRHAFETDRERDAHHLAHGTPTIRITKDRLEQTPDREAARLEAILSQRLAR